MHNILTVDVEEWYHGNDFDLPHERWSALESLVVPQTDLLLEILAKADATATFFILGCVAAAHPDLVRRIRDAGHEIASHGFYHDLVYTMTPERFASQLRDSARVLSDLAGEPVQAFRAPSWSITERSPWAFETLRRCGYRVDSSVFPLRTWMYGVKNARLDIHTNDAGLEEFPPAAVRLGGLTIPVAGGVFFRLLPYPVAAAAMRRMNRNGRPAVVYLHPWELDADHPRVPGLPARRTWYHYWGLKGALAKYTRLLGEFRFCSIRDYRAKEGGS